MTTSRVRAHLLKMGCWQLDRRPSDEYAPHYATEDEALTDASQWVEDGEPIPAVTQLPTPCWVAICASCGHDAEHNEWGPNLHYPTAAAIDLDAGDLTCIDGCQPQDLDRGPAFAAHLEDPSTSMDQLPGFDEACEMDSQSPVSRQKQKPPTTARDGHGGHSSC